MRTLLLIISITVLMTHSVLGQFTSEPRIFLQGEEITLKVNLLETATFANDTSGFFYLWTWQPSDPAVGNGTWGSSNPDLQMDKDSLGNVSFTLVPAEFYTDSITDQISFLVKRQNGDDGQTADFILPYFDLFSFDGTATTFPEATFYDDELSIIFNLDQAFNSDGSPNTSFSGTEDLYVFAYANDSTVIPLGQTGSQASELLQLEKIGDTSLYRLTFQPDEVFQSESFGALFEMSYVIGTQDASNLSFDSNGSPFNHVLEVDPNARISLSVFPSDFNENEFISIRYNPALEVNEAVKALDEVFLSVSALQGEYSAIVPFTDEGDCLVARFVPRRLLGLPGNISIENLTVQATDESGELKGVTRTFQVAESSGESESANSFFIDPEFAASDAPLNLFFDATGTSLSNAGDLYIWTWSPSDPREGNGAWTNSAEHMRMENVGGNLWKFDFGGGTPKDFYSATVQWNEVSNVSFLVKSQDGSQQTSDLSFSIVATADGLVLQRQRPSTPENILDLEGVAELKYRTSQPSIFSVFVDGEELHQTEEESDSFNYFLTFADVGDLQVVIQAEALIDEDTIQNSDTLTYSIIHIEEAPVPDGLKMGANYSDTEGEVTLLIEAPFKNIIQVIGSFNDWTPSAAYTMKRSPDRNYYWLTISGLEEGTEYPYQYLIDGEIRVADAYSHKILDTWNDGFIPSRIYPDLISVPSDQPDGLYSVLHPGKPKYNWRVQNFEAPAKEDLVIYELLVRDFTENGDYKTLRDSLSYLKSLGVNAIELMPVNQFEGNISWGYNPATYFAVDKAYGPEEELKKFIDACHELGMAVILDVVYNHSFGLAPMLRMYYDEARNQATARNPWYLQEHIFVNPAMRFGFPFDHSSESFRRFMDSSLEYWMTEFKVDGFRFDLTKGFTTQPKGIDDEWGSRYDQERVDNLERVANAVWEVNPNAYVILEHLADNSEEMVLANKGMMLWGNMHGAYTQAARGNPNSNMADGHYQARNWQQNNLVSYQESHDEERMTFITNNSGMSQGDHNIRELPTGLKRSEQAAAFFFTVPGPKMLWQFEEYGYDYSINHCPDGSIDGSCRTDPKPVVWEYLDDPDRRVLKDAYALLIKLKTENEVFKDGDFEYDLNGAIRHIILRHSSMNVVVVGNFGLADATIDIEMPSTGTWYNYMDNLVVNFADANQSFDLGPGEYLLFTSEPVREETPLSIEEASLRELRVFPNPNRGVFKVQLPENAEGAQLSVHSMDGRKIHDQLITATEIMQGNIELAPRQMNDGIYIIRLQGDGFNITKKFIKTN
ncbi:MAG: T9SS type A sorting domain-containing protein [Cyclobacteriaceae bacterium]|nr:T9SS type A sorting domain-containing protein [Cyclobacteriaceae bacterium]MCH8517503.1 T9SS type A sorting domain-containing protein [Cyclobacteriaceae bacterium]